MDIFVLLSILKWFAFYLSAGITTVFAVFAIMLMVKRKEDLKREIDQ